MSTKPIREALDLLKETFNPCGRNACLEGQKPTIDAHAAALEAVRAIEEMARTLVNSTDMGELTGATEILESIAKEAP